MARGSTRAGARVIAAPRRRWGRSARRASPRERIPYLAAHTPANIAHGGAQGHAPANTLVAFEKGMELGADALEMDLQLTADGDVVAHHDGTVDRQTDGSGVIAEMTVAQLKALDAGWNFEGPDRDFPYRGRGVEIPTLVEVFERFPDEFMVIELQDEGGPGIVEPVAKLVRRYHREESVVVASMSDAYVRRFRELLPGVLTSMTRDEIRRFYALHFAGLHRLWRPPGAVFQVPEYYDGRHVVTKRFVRAADRIGVGVEVWTVNELADMRRLLDLGVHAIMTDFPDRLAQLIAERRP